VSVPNWFLSNPARDFSNPVDSSGMLVLLMRGQVRGRGAGRFVVASGPLLVAYSQATNTLKKHWYALPFWKRSFSFRSASMSFGLVGGIAAAAAEMTAAAWDHLVFLAAT